MKKVILFGAGQIFKVFMQAYDNEKVEICAICDNNLQNKNKEDIPFIKPEEIKKYDVDYIIITCAAYDAISTQLLTLGIEKGQIIDFGKGYATAEFDKNMKELLKSDWCQTQFWSGELQKLKRQQEIQKTLAEKQLILAAKPFINSMKNERLNTLEDAEFSVFSQWGEDGIIQWLIHNVSIDRKIFVEFGVEDYQESNTRYLMMNNNWSGLVIDGSDENIRKIKASEYYWKYDLQAVAHFITKDNINSIISDAGIEGDIGLLSVDIDGNDYWVLDAITCISPRILICEYNGLYGSEMSVTIPYKQDFYRTEEHRSNLYFGASMKAFCEWAERNGYYFMGSNSAGNNAFFVRKDCIKKELLPTQRSQFVEPKFRESLGQNGELIFLRGKERLEHIKEMELVDLKKDSIKKLSDIYGI